MPKHNMLNPIPSVLVTLSLRPRVAVACESMSCPPVSKKYSRGERKCTLLLVCVLLVAFASVSHAATVRYESAGTYVQDGAYYLDSFARIELGEAPARALENGVGLYFLVEIAVHKQRRWWLDTPVLERRLRYKLYYYDLTQHYRVENMQTRKSTNYRSLAAALRKLGSLNHFALMPAAKIKNSRSYTASIRLELDRTRLPGPLMAQALVSRDWHLQSEVFRWLLN